MLIGPEWIGGSDEDGEPRLFLADDFVRLVCQLALASDTRVIPILLDDTLIPEASELQEGLQRLPRLNAFNLRTAQFDEDMDNLLDVLFGRKQGRGSRWRRGRLTPFGIHMRLVGGLFAAVALILFVAVVNDLISSSCNLECRVQQLFGLEERVRARGPMLSMIALVLLLGALLPFLSRLVARK